MWSLLGNLTRHELEQVIENWVYGKTKTSVRFDATDAISLLKELGVLHENTSETAREVCVFICLFLLLFFFLTFVLKSKKATCSIVISYGLLHSEMLTLNDCIYPP